MKFVTDAISDRAVDASWDEPANHSDSDQIREYVGEYVFLYLQKQEPYAGYKNAYHKIRYALKKISCSLGLSTPLRLHAARHSWATIAKEHGIPVHIENA